MLIDAEPHPRPRTQLWRATAIPVAGAHPLPRDVMTPNVPFLDVLAHRRSRPGGPVSERELSSVLWHSMLLRESHPTGRFGIGWESRNAPSAGGLHPLSVLTIPIGEDGVVGVYGPERHLLLCMSPDDEALRNANAKSVRQLTGAKAGTTLQIVADPTRTAACYDNSESLLLRDVGALTATICLVAAALGLQACPLGRAGTEICRVAGLPEPLVGLGAVHIGGRTAEG